LDKSEEEWNHRIVVVEGNKEGAHNENEMYEHWELNGWRRGGHNEEGDDDDDDDILLWIVGVVPCHSMAEKHEEASEIVQK
jgi:hypothetical protein